MSPGRNCKACKASFASAAAMAQHAHDKGHEYGVTMQTTCEPCQRTFATLAALKQHLGMATVHQLDDSTDSLSASGSSGSAPSVTHPVFDDNNFTSAFGRLTLRPSGAGESFHCNKADYKDLLKDAEAHFVDCDNNLKVHQRLCRLLGLNEQPSVAKGKQELKSVHFNLVDVLVAITTGERPKVFKTLAQMKNHTVANKKIFPKKLIKESGIFNVLLRDML